MQPERFDFEEGDGLLTMKEAAAEVRKTPRTLYRWIQDGTLKQVYKVGGRTLVLRSSVLNLVKPHPLATLGNS